METLLDQHAVVDAPHIPPPSRDPARLVSGVSSRAVLLLVAALREG
jgi:hypothetical protein